MQEALALARLGEGWVEPNPMVGAVIVRDGEIIGRGWHERYGGPHAEARAFEDCRSKGIDPAGATLYVTLEPCSHHGKQPPCAEAVIRSGISRVVVGMPDEFEPVAGRGIPMLREAGIEVLVGVCRDEAEQLAEPYLKRGRTGLPWVITKWAQTLDGKIATHTGDSQWISNEQSRRRVHEIRARMDAVMVGAGTARKDNPTLTARDVEIKRVARRVVVDPRLSLPSDSKLIKTIEQAPLTIAVDQKLFDVEADRLKLYAEAGVELLGLPSLTDSPRPRLDLGPLLTHLSQTHKATNVLVEGGARLVGELLRQGMVDQVLAFIAPKLMGDARATDAVVGMDIEQVTDAVSLTLRSVDQLGEDVLLDYRVRNAALKS